MDWQPIDGATPKDGRELLLLTEYGAIVGYWSTENERWLPATDPKGDVEHYMSGIDRWAPLPDRNNLPAPPALEQQQ